MSRHDSLRVRAFAKAGDIGEDAVLAECCCKACQEDHAHEKEEVEAFGHTAEGDRRDCEESEGRYIDEQGPDDTVWIICVGLQVGEDEHGNEVGDRGD